MNAIQVSRTGGPEVLELVELPDPEPSPGRIVVEVAAAGVNFIDTYQRIGLYPMDLPFVVGQEGAGTVVAVGEGVEGVQVGDVVAWTNVIGSYASVHSVPEEQAIRPGRHRRRDGGGGDAAGPRPSTWRLPRSRCSPATVA